MNSKSSANGERLISFPQILDMFSMPSPHGKVKQALGMQSWLSKGNQKQEGNPLLRASRAKHSQP